MTDTFPGDDAGHKVSSFSLTMSNLGTSRAERTIIEMLESGSWQEFSHGWGTFRFLPGEFDYFLTSHGIDRDYVMATMRDMQVKARLEAAMDERRTGEEGYRRSLDDVRAGNPGIAGHRIESLNGVIELREPEPFGYTRGAKAALVEAGVLVDKTHYREALGSAVRRYSRSGRKPVQYASRLDMLARRGARLPDEDLTRLNDALLEEKKRRGDARHT